jgi:hypothetical protein
VRGRLGYSGEEVAEAGALVNGEATGRAVVGGEHAGEGMGGTMVLTGGPGLLVGERCEREREGAADRWGRAVRRSVDARSWAAWAGEERGKTRARARLGPETAQPRGGRVFFLFLFLFSISQFHFLFLFLFISFSFESTIC